MAKVKAAPAEGENTAPAAVKAPKAPKAPKVKTKTVTKFFFEREPAEGTKMPPQLAIIFTHIKASGADGISLDALGEVLKADESFQTRQPETRVVTFYVPAMKEAGIVRVEKVQVEVAATAKTAEAPVDEAVAEEATA